jgi:hypothetical protein
MHSKQPITFQISVECKASKDLCWTYWTRVSNWAIVDPAVEWVELQGKFEQGSEGITKPVGADPNQWVLGEIIQGKSAIIQITLPQASITFHWLFEPITPAQSKITQTVKLEGEKAEEYVAAMKTLKQGIKAGMNKLVIAIEKAYIS